MATSTELDLAFSADPDLEVAPQLAGAAYWQALLGDWLNQLAPAPRRCRHQGRRSPWSWATLLSP